MQQRTMAKEGAYEDGGVRLNSHWLSDWKAVSIKEFGSVKSAVLGALPAQHQRDEAKVCLRANNTG